MLRVNLLCNAGLALEYNGSVLMIDVPNREYGEYYGLPLECWQRILEREPPYDGICGFYFTHSHPDHCDLQAVRQYRTRWPQTPVFLPEEAPDSGVMQMGPFEMEFQRFAHIPLPQGAPPHVVTWITVGEKSIYLTADAEMDCRAHRAFIKQRKADAAFWNAMYLSRPATRQLLRDTAQKSYIYHMPADRNNPSPLWRKCSRNFERYGEELKNVEVLGNYPSRIRID